VPPTSRLANLDQRSDQLSDGARDRGHHQNDGEISLGFACPMSVPPPSSLEPWFRSVTRYANLNRLRRCRMPWRAADDVHRCKRNQLTSPMFTKSPPTWTGLFARARGRADFDPR